MPITAFALQSEAGSSYQQRDVAVSALKPVPEFRQDALLRHVVPGVAEGAPDTGIFLVLIGKAGIGVLHRTANRDAVIGKVHRLGLSGRATTSRMKSIRPRVRAE